MGVWGRVTVLFCCWFGFGGWFACFVFLDRTLGRKALTDTEAAMVVTQGMEERMKMTGCGNYDMSHDPVMGTWKEFCL